MMNESCEFKSYHNGGSKTTKSFAWNECWNLSVPNVVKMFLWRALNNLLPTKFNLFKKGVVKSPLCPICEAENETVEHILWSCLSTSDVWSSGLLKLQKAGRMSGSFSDIFGNLLERCDRTEMELFAVTTRRIWLRRNAVIHGDPFLHPNQLLREAQCALDEYHRVNEGNSAQRNHDLERAIVKWQPPPANMVKMNWDATVNVKEKRVGLGLIVRDSTGNFLAARSITHEAITDPITAESLAALHAVLFSKEMSFDNVLFEGDAMQVIKTIDSKGPCFSSYGQFIEGIKLELRGVENAKFLHVLRDVNNAAHVLAKLSTTHVIFSTWLGNTPSSIGDIVRREQSLLPV